MIILKIIGKAAVLPIMLFLIVIPWIGIFLNHISGVIFGLLSGIIVLTRIASLLFGMVSGRECIGMLAAGFILFIIPHIGRWLIEKIMFLRFGLADFLRS